MAIAHYPERTLIVKVGATRGLSDLAGRHYIQLTTSETSRRAFAQRLETIGCAVRMDGDWRTAEQLRCHAVRCADGHSLELSDVHPPRLPVRIAANAARWAPSATSW